MCGPLITVILVLFQGTGTLFSVMGSARWVGSPGLLGLFGKTDEDLGAKLMSIKSLMALLAAST
jgi:hypothetical protein